MTTTTRLDQMDAEATAITARGTVAGLALGTFVLELTAEVRRLRVTLQHVEHALGERLRPGMMPERAIADLVADLDRVMHEHDELRLTLAAEQGKAEGAPSDRWHVSYDLHGFVWWRGEEDEPPEVECHLSGGEWRWTKPGFESNPYPTALDCMNAVDKDSP